MLTGRDTLRGMDKALRAARRDLERLDQELRATSGALTDNRLQQARAIDRMARIRLDAARQGEVVDHLESAMRDAERILEDRDAAVTSLNDRIRAAREAIDAMEDHRDSLHHEVDDAATVLAEREASVQKSLERDDRFQTQLEHTRQAEAIAVSALEKAELAEQDRSRKGEPFEADELFMYLWKRGYGTSAYEANLIARALDGWVARLCRYDEARPNYWMLLEIPKRLAEHAEHARAAADAELDKLQDIEELAASDGDVPEARAELERLERQQDDLDAEIAEAEGALRELNDEQSRYTAGEDDYVLQALRTISAALERRNVAELTELALATLTPEDDVIVDELDDLRIRQTELESELRDNRERQRERLARITELEDVRRDFKHNRYDDLHSRFDKGDMIERMIGEVVAGVIHGGTLWNALRRYQHYVDAAGEWPDFGSGGIVRPSKRRKRKTRERPPSWHWPGPGSRSSRGGFKLPRSGGRRGGSRGGGFRTGGGF